MAGLHAEAPPVAPPLETEPVATETRSGDAPFENTGTIQQRRYTEVGPAFRRC